MNKLRHWMAWRARWWAWDGLSVEQIAKRFACSPGTVIDLLRLTEPQPTSSQPPRDPAPADPAGTGVAAERKGR